MQHATPKGPSAVLLASLALALPVLAAGIWNPEGLSDFSKALMTQIAGSFDWFYLLGVFGIFGFCTYLAFSRYGDMRLGKPGDRPEFSLFSWLAMLFAAGMGAGLLFYGMAEPVSHYMAPPVGQPNTPLAASKALEYTFFHWGLSAWSVYALMGLVLAWMQFKHDQPGLISRAFYPLLGDKVNGPLGAAIDTLAVVATFFGVAASLGVGASQLHSGMHHVFGLPQSNMTLLAIMGGVTLLYLLSASTGLQNGIRILSNLNMGIAVLLLCVVIALGPTVEIFRALTDGLGRYAQNFVMHSLGQSPFMDRSWLHDWTLVYWPWWVAWAPFVGTFIARISRGRTIREFLVGVMLVPSVFSFVWFSAFGTTGMALVRDGFPLYEAIQNDLASALFVGFSQLPGGTILSVIALGLVAVFVVTSADSAVFVLSMMTGHGRLDPPLWLRIKWGLLQSGIAAALLLIGGLKALQTLMVSAALPFMILMIGMAFALFKGLREEAGATRAIAKTRPLEDVA